MPRLTASVLGTLVVLLVLSACGSTPSGLRLTPDGDGPVVVIDWEAEPLPEIPFPNDLATRVDPTSPTGLRLNFAADAPTESERDLREKANDLTGFGIFAPIMVRFDSRLDLDGVLARHGIDESFDDDAVYVIDVTEGSPTFGQPALLDIGGGRFPADVPRTGMFFDNDPRDASPSFLFETVEEDLDGDGVLDPGEDTDGDGVLDHPNVHPADGDPRADLLTWYEKETETLLIRVVLPLLEETTYAVVLTERLVDEAGAPVRSPWEFVNHTRQTDALEPVIDALVPLGVALDDVAFAWTFTTARVTGDLIDLRNGLHGQGPFAHLQDAFPAHISGPPVVHDGSGGADLHRLPIEAVIEPLIDSGAFPGGGGNDVLVNTFLTWTDVLVGGDFVTPNFQVDTNGDGDDSDESWHIDPFTGEAPAYGERVPFTCVLPNPSPGHQQPYPVVMAGHGQGGTRFHLLVLAWVFNRLGIAACGFDFPHHGGVLDDDALEEFGPLLEGLGLGPLVDSLGDARHRDLDNDGVADSGSDFFVADPFHTRDNVRQAALDFAQFTRAIRACGQDEMELPDGRIVPSCDWDGDGTPDIGGPDNDVLLVGASLGGINGSVAAAIEPDIAATSAIIPGGGLADGLLRSVLGGPREATLGRLITPMILGFPTEQGIELRMLVVSADKEVQVPIATVGAELAGGTIRLKNLDNGETRDGPIPADGRLRIAVACDAPSAAGKRLVVDMPRVPVGFQTYSAPDNEGLGDRLRVSLTDVDGVETVITTFEQTVVHEGVTFSAGSPLVALNEGSGHIRGTPQLRRLIQVLALASEPGDPVAYAPLWVERPTGEPVNYLMLPTVGDDVVPIAAGMTLARAGGLFRPTGVDPRYGVSVDRWLIDNGVVNGLEEFGPFVDADGTPILFDPDDLDDGSDGFDAPSDTPLRATVQTSSGFTGMRIIYSDRRGSHGWGTPDPDLPFDVNTFATFQAAWFVASRGTELLDDPCMEAGDCPYFRPEPDPDLP